MKTLNLEQFQCFSSSRSIDRLNRLVEHTSSLMPHQVASATGCGIHEAMGLLLYLASLSVLKPKLLVYHIHDQADPPNAFASLDINKGLPQLPIICNNCGQTVESYDELSFDFVFIIDEKIDFKSLHA